MLQTIFIKNLVIVDTLELELFGGLTALTGETGAGKSILLAALSLALGERANPEMIRPSHSHAEVCVTFDLSHAQDAKAWLTSHDLMSATDECIIRRVIHSEGRSKAYINGHPVTLQQLKTLTSNLIEIHGQHQHQALTLPAYQLKLLDEYANHPALLQAVADLHHAHQQLKKEAQLLAQNEGLDGQLDLLNYQISEIEHLSLKERELEIIEQEHHKLARAEELLQITHSALSELQSQERTGIQTNLTSLYNRLHSIRHIAPELANSSDMLNQALINVDEACQEIKLFIEQVELDPDKLQAFDERISEIHSLARKQRIAPEFIETHYELLLLQRKELEDRRLRFESIHQELSDIKARYLQAAHQLTLSRQKIAKRLSQQIQQRMRQLQLPEATFSIQLSEKDTSQNLSVDGIDQIEFMVSTNPGQPQKPLRKIASGGELSRISLSIQVITAQKLTIPTLIFDEVDTGISGKTAAVVGQSLRNLGEHCQVICITHLPQVSACANQHYLVEKFQKQGKTLSTMTHLNTPKRIDEIARLLGGTNITEEAKAQAKQLIEEGSTETA